MLMEIADLTSDWLTMQLIENWHLERGAVINIRSSKLDSHASAVLALEVTYSHDASPSIPSNFVCKLYLGDKFWGGWGEYLFYNELAPETDFLGAPTCFASDANVEERVCFLLLKDVTETHSLSTGSFLTINQYKQCVDELVLLHAHWWEHPKLANRIFATPLGGPLKMVQAVPERILVNELSFNEQLPQLLAGFSEAIDQNQRALCTVIGQRWYQAFAQRTESGKDLTLLHGDYHHDGNVCLPLDRSDNIRILDWETWKRGIGVYDLAYMLAYQERSDEPLERELLDYYHQRLVAKGINYSWEQCLYDYRLSLLACIFPPLYWANDVSLAIAAQACKRWNCEALLAEK